MNKFMIIRLSSLGDIIHTLPAFSALRRHFPKAEISWVVEERGKEILDLIPGIDRIVIVHTYGLGMKARKIATEILRLSKALKDKKQIALDFQGLIKSGFLAFISRSQKKIGFHKKNLKEPLASVFYTERLEELSENIHVISKNLKLLTKIGIHEEKYEFPISLPEKLSQTVSMKLRKIGYDEGKKLILYNVGGGWETKRWFPEKWVQLIEVMKNGDLFPLILWGNEREKALALTVNQHTHVPLSPPFSIKEVMALVKESGLLISGDTFALHAACAFSVPIIGIYGPTDPQRNGPFSPKDKVAVHQINCSFCFKRSCSSLECLNKITVREVAEMANQILKENA